MKTVEDILKENRELFQEDPFDEMYWEDKEAILTVMKLYASDREAKYKELWKAMKVYNKNEFMINQLTPAKTHTQALEITMLESRNDDLWQQIVSLEQELGLNKE